MAETKVDVDGTPGAEETIADADPDAAGPAGAAEAESDAKAKASFPETLLPCGRIRDTREGLPASADDVMRGREGELLETSCPAPLAAAARPGCGDEEPTPRISSLVDARTSLRRSKTESSSTVSEAGSALDLFCGDALMIPPAAFACERRGCAIDPDEDPDDDEEEKDDDDDDDDDKDDNKAFPPLLLARDRRCRGRRCFALGAFTGAMGNDA